MPLALRNLKRLVGLAMREDRIMLVLYFLTSVLGAVLLIAVYFIYKLMIDQVSKNTSVTPATSVLLIVGSYLFTEYLSRFVNFTFNQYYFDYMMRTKLQNALMRRFMGAVADMDFSVLESGQIRNLIAKVESTYSTRLPEILHTLNSIVYNVTALVFSLIIAFRFSPKYFIILGLLSAPVYYLRAKYGNVAWSQYSLNASSANYLWYIRSLFTNFQNLSEMKIYGLKDYFMGRTRELQDRILEDYRKPIARYAFLSSVSFILIPLAIYFAINNFIGGIARGTYTIGDFTFFLNTLFTFSGQISSVLLNIGAVNENVLYLNDYFSLISVKNPLYRPEHPYVFPEIGPRTIEFDHVSFAYPEARDLSLNDISLTIRRGENTAIVGHNGAGKSTLVKLLFRFYDPTRGSIRIDGIDLREMDIDQWYRHIGVLFQDFSRYFVTLRENIKFGNLGKSSDREIEDALVKSQGLDLLGSLPKGYEQVLGRWFEHGVELSGGQWQKVAIARAIYREAPILIMDEPTSAIDADAEDAIFKNLSRIYERKNLIFISHRFSTVRTADEIFVLEKGRVAEKGNHADLIRKDGLYRKFFQLQKRGYE